jgi:MoaA/NifB/PqqE/SkfB family radical SAM enzyme
MKFRKAYIEITNACNLSCDFCPRTSREPLFMDDGLFEIACAQLQGRVEHLHLHVMGEPLLHPRLEKYLDVCAFYGHRVSLITNGLLLAQRGPGLTAKPALRLLGVSLHSYSGQMDEAGLRSYLEAVKNFAALAADGSRCIVQMRFWNKGVDSASQAGLFQLIEETFCLPYSLEDKLKTRRSFMLGTNLCLDSSAPFQWPSLDNEDYGGQGTCYGLRRQCAVLADGTVTACCLDNNGTLDLGNIRERSLTDIFSGIRAVAIRGGFEQGVVVEELCRKCPYRLRFKLSTPRREPDASS